MKLSVIVVTKNGAQRLIRKGKSPARRLLKARILLKADVSEVVELGIVDRASDSTIGRALKKTLSSPIADKNGSFRRRPTARS